MKENLKNENKGEGTVFSSLKRRIKGSLKKKDPALKGMRIKEGMIEHHSVGGWIADIVMIAFLLLCALICIVPMWHTLMSSLSDGFSLFANHGIVWWPVGEANLDCGGRSAKPISTGTNISSLRNSIRSAEATSIPSSMWYSERCSGLS